MKRTHSCEFYLHTHTLARVHERTVNNRNIIVNIYFDWWGTEKSANTQWHKMYGVRWMLQIENSIWSIYFLNFASLHPFMEEEFFFVFFYFLKYIIINKDVMVFFFLLSSFFPLESLKKAIWNLICNCMEWAGGFKFLRFFFCCG